MLKKFFGNIVLVYLVFSGAFLAFCFTIAPIGGKIIIAAITFAQFKMLLFWALTATGLYSGVGVLKETYPEKFKRYTSFNKNKEEKKDGYTAFKEV